MATRPPNMAQATPPPSDLVSSKIIADTSALIRFPELLAVRHRGTVVVVPTSVGAELALHSVRHGELRGVAEMLYEGVREGRIRIAPDAGARAAVLAGGPLSDVADAEVLACAKAEQAEGVDVVLATEDADLMYRADRLGIRALGGSKLRALVSTLSTETAPAERAKGVTRTQRRRLLFNVLGGLLSAAIAPLASALGTELLGRVKVGIVAGGVVVVGVVVFWFRSRFRLAYGVAECGVGVWAAMLPLWPKLEFSTIKAVQVLQVFGAIYIIVRGLDNIGKGLDTTRFAPSWRRLFGK